MELVKQMKCFATMKLAISEDEYLHTVNDGCALNFKKTVVRSSTFPFYKELVRDFNIEAFPR